MFILLLSFDTQQDLDKFEYVFGKYRRLMLSKAYEILHDYHLAEDAASEAFIRIYKNIHKIGDPTDNRTIAFVVTIVKNVALTMLKKARSYETQELDEDIQDSFDLEEQTLSELGAEQIYRAVGELGEELKSVFLLKYVHDFSHKDIGRLLGITENNVTVRLHRAKRKLMETLR